MQRQKFEIKKQRNLLKRNLSFSWKLSQNSKASIMFSNGWLSNPSYIYLTGKYQKLIV